MILDLQYKIKNDNKCMQYLMENSYWIKSLNRNPASFNTFMNDMKEKYKLRTTDKINDMMDKVSLISSFLDIIK